MTTSSEMVTTFFANTGALLTDFWPLVYLILGVFLFLFAYRLFFTKGLLKALKDVTK